MSVDIKVCAVSVLNKNYEIKCPIHEEKNLIHGVSRLNTLLGENKKKFTELTEYQLMLLSAITLAHELINCEQQQIQEREQVAKVVQLLERNKLLLQTMHPTVDTIMD